MIVCRLDSICGAPAAMQRAGCAYTVAFSREKDVVFFTVGDHTLRVWELDLDNRKIHPTDCDLGLIKRVSKCLVPSLDDSYLLTGTTTGDIVQINTTSRVLHGFGPQKHKYPLGTYVSDLYCASFIQLVMQHSPELVFSVSTL